MYPEYRLLMQSQRSDFIDEEHRGLIILFDENGKVLRKIGEDNDYLFWHRSCMKPFQLAAISEIIKYYKLKDEEIAVCTASHAGDDIHLKAVRSVLNKAGETEESLLCPPHTPLSREANKKLILNSEKPRSIHHNCSGKHAAILAYCKMKGLDIKNYNDINHPVQKKILKFVSEICEYPEYRLTKDGCTLPVIGTPLKNLAKGFINLCTNPDYKNIINAVQACPYHFGGEERTDTQIIIAGGKKLVAKVGAGNLCCVTDIGEKNCLIIKVADYDNFSRGFILTEVLKSLGKLPDYKKSSLPELFPSEIKTDNGEIIGKRKITFVF